MFYKLIHIFQQTIHDRLRHIILKNIFFFFCIIALSSPAFSQSDTIRYEAGISTVASTGQYAPFWLHNNNYGKIASTPEVICCLPELEKDWTTR